MREPFSERLEKRVVVCDGAMGTLLYAKGISLSRCFDELNLSAPPWVKDIHVGYVKAGAVGPLGVRMEPLGPTSREEARAAFREQMEALVEGGVDLIIIETMVDLEEARQA